MDARFSDCEVTPHQAALANRIEQVLAHVTQYQRREARSEGNGPSVDFDLRTRPPNVTVRIIVYQDSVQVGANQALVIIELVRPKSYAKWVEDAVSAVTALIGAPLRIRVRETLIKRRPTGAIYLEQPNRNGWNGDLLSCLGAGRILTFADWFVPVRSG
jgi:hypothetical protein